LTAFRLERLDETDGASAFIAESSYSNTSFTLQPTITLTTGKIYRFRTVGINAKGESVVSDELRVGCAPLPSAPQAPTVDRTMSNETSLAIRYQALIDSNSPAGNITGYQLYMASSPYSLVYDTILNNTNAG
jgi:hypothetical protein